MSVIVNLKMPLSTNEIISKMIYQYLVFNFYFISRFVNFVVIINLFDYKSHCKFFQLQSFLSTYLDIQNMTSDMQISDIADTNDISEYFSRRKQHM